MQRLKAPEAIAHPWIQEAVPKVLSDQTEVVTKEIQRMKKGFPQNIVRRLGLRAVAYAFVLVSLSLDKTFLAFFHYMDQLNVGSINGDGLRMLVPDYPESELECTLSDYCSHNSVVQESA